MSKDKTNKQKVYEKTITKKENKNLEIEVITSKSESLSDEHKQIASDIKAKLRKTAELIVEIGTEISNAVQGKSKEYKELFYAEMGMSKRSAQRYQQLANNPKILELQKENQLEGKTMQDLLQLIHLPQKTPTESDTRKVAQGFFAKYKNDTAKLTAIIAELQELLKQQEESSKNA